MMMKPEVTPGWNDLDARRSSWLNIMGRLKPGLTLRQAQAGMEPLWHSIRAEELAESGHYSSRFKQEFLTNSHMFLADGSKGIAIHGTVTGTLLVVSGLAALIALMVCTNVGSLLLVRSAARTREFSVRYALGAKRSAILQQLLSEGMLLGLAGGLAGILLAPQITAILIHTIWTSSGEGTPFSSHLDWRILVFNFLLAIIASLLFSMAPALQFWRPEVTLALKQQAAVISGGSLRLRRASVVAQIGISLLLLVGAGLFVRTLHNLKAQNVGFATDHLVTFAVEPRLAGYDSDQTADLFPRILENLRGLPGVRNRY
jgi:putative ABC transport system permease protein